MKSFKRSSIAAMCGLSGSLSGSLNSPIVQVANGFSISGTNGSTYSKNIDTLLFATETTGRSINTYSVPVVSASALSAASNGYILGGGTQSGIVATISKMPYVTQLITNLTSVLSQPTSWMASARSLVAGFTFSGTINNGSNYTNLISTLLFSTEIRTNLSATISRQEAEASGLNSSDNAYVLGGALYSAPWVTAAGDAFAFATNTIRSIGTVLNTGNYNMFALSFTTAKAGYVFGGDYSSTSANKLAFATETHSTLTSLYQRRSSPATIGVNSLGKGYILGGANGALSYSTTVTRFTQSTETLIDVSATLTNGINSNLGLTSDFS